MRAKRATFTGIGCCVLLVALLLDWQKEEQALAQENSADIYGRGFQILVEKGDDAEALNYYKNVVARDTGFNTESDPKPLLNDLLTYFGYSLKGEDLEKDEPEAIMKSFPGGDVLVSRFFAPKITDVSSASNIAYGWRKVIRLRAQASSDATNNGLKSMYVLFNVFNKNLGVSPFKTDSGGVNHSVNNQVILIRGTGKLLTQPAYFMTFGAYNAKDVKERGRLITYLEATFDAAVSPNVKKYYVPTACAACHGTGRPKLNYLDTDHWFDRIRNDDFDEVGKKQPLLFDAGTNDSTKPEFKKAFDVLRTLNTEIRDQNREADETIASFQQLAAESWLRNHATTDHHLSLFQRSITFSGNERWSENDPIDKELLPLLNRYCFRCHSSLRYHIYDKRFVMDHSGIMIKKIKQNPNGNTEDFMPQDRELRDPDRSRLLDLLVKLRPW
jgi:hypothetical protein